MLLKNLKGYKIILASKSPRRQALLGGLDLDFEIRTKDVDEVYSQELKGSEVARYLSELKAKSMLEDIDSKELLITSDTIVILGDRILEKPVDRNSAIEMLSQLSGNTHEVVTAVTLTTNTWQNTFHDTTSVSFNSLSREEIEYYIDSCEPYDKAGSYGVQELMGYIGIQKINGCYYNVMGLPLQKLYKELKKIVD